MVENTPIAMLDDSEEVSSNSHMLMVALYLVLLAFFILLNSLALTDQERSQEAIKSVTSSFNAKEKGAVLLTKTPKPVSMEIIIKDYYKNLQHLAQDYIEAEELSVTQEGNVLSITFPSASLFLDGRSLIRDDKRAFLKNIAKSVYPGIPSTTLQLQIITTSRHYLSDSVTPNAQIELLRVGALARYLTANRVPSENIRTGTVPGKENTITLRFDAVSNAPEQFESYP